MDFITLLQSSAQVNNTATGVLVLEEVPLKLFGIVFLIILVAFLVWYLIMRRRV